MDDSRIEKIERGQLIGRRPRGAGPNSRVGPVGDVVVIDICRITLSSGVSGFGLCRAQEDEAEALIDQRFEDLFDPTLGVLQQASIFDYPLWDMAGKLAGQPVYRLASALAGSRSSSVSRVRCYDTSIYFDDIHAASEGEAAEIIADEIRDGKTRGHLNFKLKIGRCSRFMPLESGMARDVSVVRSARKAIGATGRLMVDANSGYNLALAKQFLDAAADCDIYWLEEAFAEDPVLYADLREWMQARNLNVLIADGEVRAPAAFLDWVRDGYIDVVQFDHFGHTFTRWLRTAAMVGSWSAYSAPHNFGNQFGNYAVAHLTAACPSMLIVEWDEVATPGLDTSAFLVQDGFVHLPDIPGFGLALDDSVFEKAVADTGYVVGRQQR